MEERIAAAEKEPRPTTDDAPFDPGPNEAPEEGPTPPESPRNGVASCDFCRRERTRVARRLLHALDGFNFFRPERFFIALPPPPLPPPLSPPSQVASLKEQIQNVRSSKGAGKMSAAASKHGPLRELRKPIKARRTLKGHFGKVYAMHWASDNQTLVSASQDGKLIVWNALTTNKVQAVPLRSSWVMTCAFEQSKGNLIACGGLDNVCSIYNIQQQSGANNARAARELVAHDGYLSCVRFVDEGHVVTSSGDSSCIYWDAQSGDVVKTFNDHTGDVMSVCISPDNPNLFASGSVDTTAKIWDLRIGKCVQTHTGHELDINSVAFFPDGFAVGTGSDDSTCRLFDMRCYGEVNKFANPRIACGITSVAFSKSGRLMFGGYDDFNAYAWDTLADGNQSPYALPGPHENRVSCLGVNDSGDAMCTGSWVTNLKVSVVENLGSGGGGREKVEGKGTRDAVRDPKLPSVLALEFCSYQLMRRNDPWDSLFTTDLGMSI
ncbi:hypothetical protein ACHAWF_010818 [Thalassiosira exigua]